MRSLFRIIRFFIYTVILVIVFGIPALLWAVIEDAPRVSGGERLTVEDVERVKRLLRDLDPRQLQDGETRKLHLSERDASLLVNQLLLSRWPGGNVEARIAFIPALARMEFSLRLPDNPLGRYLNASLDFVPDAAGLTLTQAQMGRLSLPGALIQWLSGWAEAYWQDRAEYRELMQVWTALSEVDIGAGQASITVRYDAALARRLEAQGRKWALPETDRLRLLVYNDVLLKEARALPKNSSLVFLLKPLLVRAAERTALGGDPVEENRAALTALAVYLADKNPVRLLGEDYVVPPPIHPRLAGRGDLAQHFAVSAALVAVADSHIANVIGVFKEVQDSRGGSGFSFADLAADRAGVRFAERATASAAAARDMQQRASQLDAESAIMPAVDALPEGMQEPEFVRRFQRRESAAYTAVQAEIERRLDRLSFYSDPK